MRPSRTEALPFSHLTSPSLIESANGGTVTTLTSSLKGVDVCKLLLYPVFTRPSGKRSSDPFLLQTEISRVRSTSYDKGLNKLLTSCWADSDLAKSELLGRYSQRFEHHILGQCAEVFLSIFPQSRIGRS